MNRWNIPPWLEREIMQRDVACVYCRVPFDGQPASRGKRPSWEHIINDAAIVTRENIARCCMSCNASKGCKDLSVWMQSEYCLSRGITRDTVAVVIQHALDRAAGG